MWDLIVSVPDRCLCFYFSYFGNGYLGRSVNVQGIEVKIYDTPKKVLHCFSYMLSHEIWRFLNEINCENNKPDIFTE